MGPTLDIMPNPLVVALQLAPFAVTAAALYKIIFKPTLAYLDERWAAIDGTKKRASELEARAAARLADYEAQLNKARAEVMDLRAARRAEALAQYSQIVATARTDAEKRVADALVELGHDRAGARATMEASANSLANDIANQVLGRTVAAG